MTNSKVEAIEQLFLAFNREVGKNRPLVENYLDNLTSVDTETLVQAVNHLIMNSDRLPRWTELKHYCDSQRTLKRNESVDCPDCWGIGMVYNVYFDGNRVMSNSFIPETKGYYYSCVTGRCDCPNGEIYHRSMPISRYSQIVMDEFGTGAYIAPAQACDEIVIRKNQQLRALAETNTEG
tara:strand:- start:1542 stop:2078 length:537 start_codon:yes stop_codon:yes gene_type:complete